MDTNELLRLLIGTLLILHAITHIIWFLAAWTRYDFGMGHEAWVLPGNVTLTSWFGRIIGLLAVVVMLLFLLAAIGVFMQHAWWRGAGQWGVFLSMVVVLPWWLYVPHRIGLQAVIANIVLMFLIALPLSVEIIT